MALLIALMTTIGTNLTPDGMLQAAVELRVRDFLTGYGVNSNIQVRSSDQNPAIFLTDVSGNFTCRLYPATYEFVISADGYQQVKTGFTIENGKTLDVLVHLSPITVVRSESEDLTATFASRATAILHGIIVDKNTGKPLDNVKIKAHSANVATSSNLGGYFSMTLAAVDIERNSPFPRETFFFSKPDYKTLEFERYVVAGKSYLKIALEPGAGVENKKEEQGLFEHRNATPRSEKDERCPSCKRKDFAPDSASILAYYLDPPPIIRVGTNCTGYDCTNVEVMTLEAYVQSGIDDEWIASWHSNSLRAGSLPYRSYGAWYVYNPVAPNYDITNNTYCQVWQSDQYQSCIDAATYTSGIMVEYNNAVARSEYSAENNDCGCGDGASGTGTSWPCIDDTPCTGEECYGHGRGMCQWGSQRWAYYEGADWYWINNHYYNPGDYYPSTPMYITDATAVPDTVAQLETFTIDLNTYSGAEHAHPNIMIGASLYLDGNYVSDPANDNKVTINVGSDSVSRIFVVPVGTVDGTYDLLLALWFDVDENNMINAGDFPLYTMTLYDAVVVTSFPGVHDPGIKNIPHDYALAVSPNPARTSDIVISYSLPHAEKVTLRLFDILGREIFKRTIYCEQGHYAVPMKTANLAPAVYFVQLETERQNLIKKIAVLK